MSRGLVEGYEGSYAGHRGGQGCCPLLHTYIGTVDTYDLRVQEQCDG